MNEGNGKIKCLTDCDKYFSKIDINRFLTKEEQKKLEYLAQNKKIATDKTLYNCLSPDCKHVFKWDGKNKEQAKVYCNDCRKYSCLSCLV